MYQDLSHFIRTLEAQGELVRITARVSPELEITEISDRVMKSKGSGNKALLFENVAGNDIPVVINLFGSARRMALALGVDSLDDLNLQLADLLDLNMPQGLGAAFSRGQELLNTFKSMGVKPRILRGGPAQEVISTENPSLTSLPILKCWPKDGGRFITLPQVITRDPQKGVRNVGMYRLQVLDEKTLLVHWQRHKGGADHQRKAQKAHQAQIPAAIVLGGDPACIWAASAPLPPDIDEYWLAGYLRGAPVEFVRCVSQPLEVPANAEIVIEGYVDVQDQRPEGPFGDHTGYYTPVELFPTFHVTAITQRQKPVYPATIVGIPPMEDAWMGKATERLFLPLMRLFLPEIVDVHLPPEGVFHNLVLVSIRKRFPGQARKVIHGLWGLGLMSLTKAIVIVDHWVNVQNLSQTAWQVLGNVDWSRDVIITDGPVDHLDHASYGHSFGGKIGIDATRKFPEEGYTRQWPEVIQMDPEVKARVDALWPQLGLSL